jgi:hypothetical protein
VVVWWVRNRKTAPPSRVSSEGGVGGGVVGKKTGNRPLRLAFQAREGSVVVLLGLFSRILIVENKTHLGPNDERMFRRCLAHLTSTSSSSPFPALLSVIVRLFVEMVMVSPTA